MTPAWAQLGYLAAAVCFIVALKGLSSPRRPAAATSGGWRGARVRDRFVVSDVKHLIPILAAIAAGTAIGVLGAYRVPDDSDAPTRSAVQRCGGGAAAIVAIIELAEFADGPAPVFDLIATAFTIVVGSVSFAGSVVTFLKLKN